MLCAGDQAGAACVDNDPSCWAEASVVRQATKIDAATAPFQWNDLIFPPNRDRKNTAPQGDRVGAMGPFRTICLNLANVDGTLLIVYERAELLPLGELLGGTTIFDVDDNILQYKHSKYLHASCGPCADSDPKSVFT